MTRVGWIRLLVIVAAVGVLEVACRAGFIDHRVVIPPSEMVMALVKLFVTGQFTGRVLRDTRDAVCPLTESVPVGGCSSGRGRQAPGACCGPSAPIPGT